MFMCAYWHECMPHVWIWYTWGTRVVHLGIISLGGQIGHQVPWNLCDRIGSGIHPKRVCVCVEATVGHWESWCITLPYFPKTGIWKLVSSKPSAILFFLLHSIGVSGTHGHLLNFDLGAEIHTHVLTFAHQVFLFTEHLSSPRIFLKPKVFTIFSKPPNTRFPKYSTLY